MIQQTGRLAYSRQKHSVWCKDGSFGVLNNLLDKPAEALQEDRKNMMSETATDDVLYVDRPSRLMELKLHG